MSGALKKTMIYLGLADGEDYDEIPRQESRERRPAAAEDRPAAAASSPAEHEQRAAAEPASAAAVPAEREQRPARAEGSRPAASDQTSRPSRAESSEQEYRAPVTPIKRAAASASEGAPVRTLTTVHPRSYNDAKSIGEAFRSGMPVIMNVTELGDNEAKRLVDFSAGLVFGLHGSISRITNKVFLLTPSTVEVMGDENQDDGEHAALFTED
ncbi:cell division protein SepF [Micrococcus lylae]|uniref:Cell division protein SepF n=1 Tax=Micrococcus lylae TaxID=1273 RepID=A0ABY2K0S5_9MICC|nr:cell division protein SepF [Micrococcus lylae]MCT2007816.1 cell division protein SepF [Micrococcus lylae]MCT2072016.1 cell division protein SepF [Micrococcus lylae]TFI00190.1 cell division protein SepF [Micrococcus lylae]